MTVILIDFPPKYMTRTTWEANIFFIRGLNTKTQTVVFYLTQSGSSDKPNPVGFFLLYKNCVVESDYDFAEEIAD